ncbi:MAG: pyruvate, phosphate dikinase [Candidatus Sericytochromatia bacterium]|nr:pyruvate, phosphate dikinase [Candidatus Tanganyikabacteria bacterium]
MTATKRVYLFHEGNAGMRELLGGKGAGLAEMASNGLPVPPGFTITTEMCLQFLRNGERMPDGLEADWREAMGQVEKDLGKVFGDPHNPLLVSVRSGAKFSMPGMMDTILNLGLNDQTVQGVIAQTSNERFAYDAYRRFISMFSNVVLGLRTSNFEFILEQYKHKLGVKLDTDLDADTLKDLVRAYKAKVESELGLAFPDDPHQQLRMAIEAVFKSWNSDRAITYRRHEGIPDSLGTAVNVQAMVFGNMGEDSATGVAFTRNPSNGEPVFYGEFLTNAQGEDVVAGIRTPRPIVELGTVMPEAHKQLLDVAKFLEKHYREMQDIEFTIERGKLFMLQTRTGKRTGTAAARIAFDLVEEGVISKQEAVMRLSPGHVVQMLLPQLDPSAKVEVLAKGLGASPGTIGGELAFTADEAKDLGEAGKAVLLVRPETSPDDIHGMIASKGVLTSRGGNTSHAAVVARGMGKPCVVGCEQIRIDEEKETLTTPDGQVFRKGDLLSINGTTGEVLKGLVPTLAPEPTSQFRTIMTWADEARRLKVRANADTPEDARRAREFGAEGIGLCRSEHMFFAPDRLPIVQEMILAETDKERQAALDKLQVFQRADFAGLFRAMAPYPVTIRLLDPPLHEFLPNLFKLGEEVARLEATGADPAELEERRRVLRRVEAMHEINPMMGLRGCRLGLTRPEINEMQFRAIFEAACEVAKEGLEVNPEIMVPLTGHASELQASKDQLEAIAREVMEKEHQQVDYLFGTMIEVPRAAIVADQLGGICQFFSFGTNDLTQMTWGFSRDDAERGFLFFYLEHKLLTNNPFQVLDREGVGALMKMAVERGRQTNPQLKLGICGEHGGDPESIAFCHDLDLHYVSCSPFRVPVARLAAAHSALAAPEHDR